MSLNDLNIKLLASNAKVSEDDLRAFMDAYIVEKASLLGLWLHFSEEREVVCGNCDGTGIQQRDVLIASRVIRMKGNKCVACSGTRRRRIKVTGAVSPIITTRITKDYHFMVDARVMHEGISYCAVEVEAKHHMIDPTQCKDSLVIQQPLVDAVIAAYLADELPGDVAKWITREEL